MNDFNLEISDYDLDFNEAIINIKKNNFKKILLQIPEGLKEKFKEITEFLENKTSSSYIISADSCFGACDFPMNIEKDIDIRGAVERYLYLATQATIDLAEATIAYRNFRKPQTLSDAFYILNENEVIDKNLTEKMIEMTGFRNAIAHGYEDINYKVNYEVIQGDIKDVQEFINVITDKLRL